MPSWGPDLVNKLISISISYESPEGALQIQDSKFEIQCLKFEIQYLKYLDIEFRISNFRY